jgi:hypothetical protein
MNPLYKPPSDQNLTLALSVRHAQRCLPSIASCGDDGTTCQAAKGLDPLTWILHLARFPDMAAGPNNPSLHTGPDSATVAELVAC